MGTVAKKRRNPAHLAVESSGLEMPDHRGKVEPVEYHENPYMNLLIKNSLRTEIRRVCIGIPMTGTIRTEWALARWGQIIPTNWSASDAVMYMTQTTPLGYNVADARNIICHVAMEQGFEWLLFIDSDVILPPHCFRTMNNYMQKNDIPVVFGLYFTKSDPSEPLVYRGSGTGYFRDFKLGDKFWVSGIGMGCTLIKVDILRAMAGDTVEYLAGGTTKVHKIFDTPQMIWTDPEQCSVRTLQGTEDLAWCTRVVEGEYFAKAGYPKIQKRKYGFLCDSSVTCLHIREDGQRFPQRWIW
jgi:hypothetical protein